MYENKEKARQALRDLLLERGVLSSWQWDRVKRAVFNDPRFEALKRETEKKQVCVCICVCVCVCMCVCV